MKQMLIVLAIMVLFTSQALAIKKTIESSNSGEVIVTSTETMTADETPMMPTIKVGDLPDVEKVLEVAEEEGTGLGPYGAVIVLVLAAIAAFIKAKKKKKDDEKPKS